MRKEVNLIDGNKEIITVESAGCISMTNIAKGYMKDGELVKGINFAISDDMAFHGYYFQEKDDYLDLIFITKDIVLLESSILFNLKNKKMYSGYLCKNCFVSGGLLYNIESESLYFFGFDKEKLLINYL